MKICQCFKTEHTYITGNDKEKYKVMMDHASKLITPSELSVLKLGLSLHIYSPKVQMFQQIAGERNLPNCPAIADIGGTFTCDADKIKSLIDNVSTNIISIIKILIVLLQYKEGENKVDVYNVDTHYPGSENRTKVAILYAELGTKEFSQFHSVLKQEAEEGKIDYIVRHYIQVVSSTLSHSFVNMSSFRMQVTKN